MFKRKRSKLDKIKKIHPVIQIPIEWGDHTKTCETIYVNNCKVSYTGKEFYLLLGETIAPMVLAGENYPERIEIVPKVRLAISENTMKDFVKILDEAYDDYLIGVNNDG